MELLSFRGLFPAFAPLAALVLACPVALAQAPPSPSPARTALPPAADAGPAIEVAPEHGGPERRPTVALGAGAVEDPELVRGLTEQRFRAAVASATSTSVGGYGEAVVLGTRAGGADREWVADLPRFVVFVAHAFTDRIRVYAELEVEHATACKTCGGEVEMEQAYLDWKVGGDAFGLRAGMLLVPMGIINQWHEPPVFNGVLRPRVETVVIPSTWHDVGAGFAGRPAEWLRYELYGLSGLDPLGLGPGGLAEARQDGDLAKARSWAVAARAEAEPALGVVLGASFYGSDLGGNAGFYARTGQKTDLHLPLLGWEADARWRRAGLEWKLLYAEWHLPRSGELMASLDATGKLYFPDPRRPVPTRIRGAYVELAYDVLRPFGLTHQLLPFGRLEIYDTQSAVPDGYRADPSFDIRELTLGLSYRPIQQVVFKTDFQLRAHATGTTDNQMNVGLGFMY